MSYPSKASPSLSIALARAALKFAALSALFWLAAFGAALEWATPF